MKEKKKNKMYTLLNSNYEACHFCFTLYAIEFFALFACFSFFHWLRSVVKFTAYLFLFLFDWTSVWLDLNNSSFVPGKNMLWLLLRKYKKQQDKWWHIDIKQFSSVSIWNIYFRKIFIRFEYFIFFIVSFYALHMIRMYLHSD